MDGTTNVTGVTPQGVRTGDPAALHGLVERRGPAVVAFCTQVCGPADAAAAAAEAFARFRAAVRDAVDLGEIDPEGLLRGATRHSAAAMARVPLGPPPSGRLHSRGTQTCEHVPVMLAARANGALGEADLERLARHLDRCERCHALSDIFRRAEIAYADPSADTLPADTFALLLEALEAVSLEGPGYAPPPATPGALPTQITGALPTLPDLDDEIQLAPAVSPAPVADVAAGEHEDTAAGVLDDSDDPDDPDDDDGLGTYEFEPVLATEPEPEPASATAEPDRRGATRLLTIMLPVAAVLGVVVAVLLASGVLSPTTSAPAVHRPIATGIQAPVTTPLPVTVATPAAGSAATAGPAAGSVTPTGATAAPASGATSGTPVN